ncbi:hypothetical protein KBC75_01770 [Candidatus Shapirobacteria bacterium]|nr:hypothetical protein [Candidatus Shapirobacteria bacterium]
MTNKLEITIRPFEIKQLPTVREWIEAKIDSLDKSNVREATIELLKIGMGWVAVDNDFVVDQNIPSFKKDEMRELWTGINRIGEVDNEIETELRTLLCGSRRIDEFNKKALATF